MKLVYNLGVKGPLERATYGQQDVHQGQQDVHEVFKQFQSSEAHPLHSLTSQHPSQLLTTCTASKTCSVKILRLVRSGTHSAALCIVTCVQSRTVTYRCSCIAAQLGLDRALGRPGAWLHSCAGTASSACKQSLHRAGAGTSPQGLDKLIQDNESLGRPPAGVHAPSCRARRVWFSSSLK